MYGGSGFVSTGFLKIYDNVGKLIRFFCPGV
jgi:hypothetical protein